MKRRGIFEWKCFELKFWFIACIGCSTDFGDLEVGKQIGAQEYEEETNIFVQYNEEFVKSDVS